MADAAKPSFLVTLLSYLVMAVLAIIVVPTMWFMAYLYPVWETWIKENGDLFKYPWRLVLIIPFTVLMLVAMIIYHGLHKTFEENIKEKFGLKLF